MEPLLKKKFKTQAHGLNPVVIVGQSGLTDAVAAETEVALNAHELIKVKVRAEREERKAIIERLCAETGAELIQAIGQIAVIHRLNPKKKAKQIPKPSPRKTGTKRTRPK